MRTSPPRSISKAKDGVATSSSPFPKALPYGDEDIASPFHFQSKGRGGDVHIAAPNHSQRAQASSAWTTFPWTSVRR
jgi:hypothetical protein